MSTLKTNNIQHVDRSEPSIIINTDGGVSIAGTLTYEDVTSVDAVGIVTARGLSIFGNTTGLNVASGISTFQAVTGTTGTFTGDVDIADKIVHTGDTNTAIRFPAADTVSVETSGSEALRIDSSQRLLLGTTSVGNASAYYDNLVISNTTSAEGSGITLFAATNGYNAIDFGDTAAVGRGRLTYYHADDSLRVDVAGSEKLRFASNGNIGIAGTAGTDFSLLGGVVINTASGDAGLIINSSSSSHNAYMSFGYGSGSGTSHQDQFSAYIGRVGDNKLIFGTNNTLRAQFDSSGHFTPNTDDTYDLGSSSLKWKDLHADGLLYIGSANTYIKDNQFRFGSTGAGYIDHYTTGQDINFRTSVSSALDTTGMTLKSNGNLAFASGKGIDFSATGDGTGSNQDEIFDDYEQGTWTPSFTQGVSGGSYSSQAGHYTRVGRLVMISCRIDGSGLSATNDHLLLGGLPFTTVASGGTAGGLYFAYSDNFYSGSSGTNLALTIIVNNNATVCEFFDGDGTQKRGDDFYDVNRNIHIVGTYHAA